MHKISKEQMRALDGSIEKWNQIRNRQEVDRGRSNCPLCQLYNNSKQYEQCKRCVVYLDTGARFCEKSPYEAWLNHYKLFHSNTTTIKYGRKSECPECDILANDEYEFLKDLKTRCEVSTYKSIIEPFIIFIRNIIYI